MLRPEEMDKAPTTKQKLSSIVQGFDEFDVEMKRGTRVSYPSHEFSLNLQFSFKCSSSDEKKMNFASLS